MHITKSKQVIKVLPILNEWSLQKPVRQHPGPTSHSLLTDMSKKKAIAFLCSHGTETNFGYFLGQGDLWISIRNFSWVPERAAAFQGLDEFSIRPV